MEIKNIIVADSLNFLNFLLKLDSETNFMMLEPDERDTSVENMKSRLLNIDESKSVYLGAFDDERIVGYINLFRGGANRIRHSAYIVMGILSSHTGKGIGKLLLHRAEEWAKKHNVSRLELTVMVHNIRAVKLYEKAGFVKEGIKKKSMLVDGACVDEYYMGKILCK